MKLSFAGAIGNELIFALSEFQQFSDLFERIKNRPEFADVKIGNVSIPKFEGEEIKKASVGASILLEIQEQHLILIYFR